MKASHKIFAGMIGWAVVMGGATGWAHETTGTSNVAYGLYVGPRHDVQSTAAQVKAITGTPGYGTMSHNFPDNPPKSVQMRNMSSGVVGPWTNDVTAGDSFYLAADTGFPLGANVRMQVRSSLWTGHWTTVRGQWRSN